MRTISPLSFTLVISATAAAVGIEIARRLSASNREIAAVRSTASHLSERLLHQDQAIRDHRSDKALTASDILSGMHQRYMPAILGGLTAVSLQSGQCGVILTTAQSDDRFLLAAADLEKLITTGARYLARYHLTKVQSLKESLGSRSEVFSPDDLLK